MNDHWGGGEDIASFGAFWQRNHTAIIAAAGAGRDVSIADVTAREDRWTPLFDYWCSIANAADSDQVSVQDLGRRPMDQGLLLRGASRPWPSTRGFGTPD